MLLKSYKNSTIKDQIPDHNVALLNIVQQLQRPIGPYHSLHSFREFLRLSTYSFNFPSLFPCAFSSNTYPLPTPSPTSTPLGALTTLSVKNIGCTLLGSLESSFCTRKNSDNWVAVKEFCDCVDDGGRASICERGLPT